MYQVPVSCTQMNSPPIFDVVPAGVPAQVVAALMVFW